MRCTYRAVGRLSEKRDAHSTTFEELTSTGLPVRLRANANASPAAIASTPCSTLHVSDPPDRHQGHGTLIAGFQFR